MESAVAATLDGTSFASLPQVFRRTRTRSDFKGAEDSRAVVLACHVSDRLQALGKLRQFAIFAVFFILYLTIVDIRSDWPFARLTYERWEMAIHDLNVEEFNQHTNMGETIKFLDTEVPNIFFVLKMSKCQNCEVALTDIAVDLSSLSLLQFICSDFDSTEGSSDVMRAVTKRGEDWAPWPCEL